MVLVEPDQKEEQVVRRTVQEKAVLEGEVEAGHVRVGVALEVARAVEDDRLTFLAVL
jgi:hypothetical protein